MPDCDCDKRFGAVYSHFTSMTWVIGIVITMQLACFGWLGYLTKTIGTIDNGSAVMVERVANLSTDIHEMKSAVNIRLDKINDKLDLAAKGGK